MQHASVASVSVNCTTVKGVGVREAEYPDIAIFRGTMKVDTFSENAVKSIH